MLVVPVTEWVLGGHASTVIASEHTLLGGHGRHCDTEVSPPSGGPYVPCGQLMISPPTRHTRPVGQSWHPLPSSFGICGGMQAMHSVAPPLAV